MSDVEVEVPRVQERDRHEPEPPYPVIASEFKARTLIPFLGSAASAVGAAPTGRLPVGAELAAALSEFSSYPGSPQDSLSKIAQYLEEIPADREILLKKIAEIFYDRVPPDYETAFTRFLRRLPSNLLPRVIITTNYDTLVERALGSRPYVVVCQVRRGPSSGQFLYYGDSPGPIIDSEVLTSGEIDDTLDDLRKTAPDTVVVFKMHGTARMRTASGDLLDSVVLTEGDYVDFLVSERSMKIPSAVLELLVKSSVLFLGYSLADWNLRVLLRRIRAMQAGKSRRPQDDTRKYWAILRSPDAVEAEFWAKRNVKIYNADLGAFLDGLAQKIGL